MKLQIVASILALPLFLGCSAAPKTPPTDNLKSEKITIYRDAYGTPQIVADSNRGVYYGYGYAVASDRLYQMDMLRRTTQGKVAEVLGQDFVDLDVHLRTAYDHRNISEQLEALPPQQYEILAAYAAGFNTRIDEVLLQKNTLLPIEFTDNDFLPQHWTAYDVAMLFAGSIAHRYSDFNSERDNLELLQHLETRHTKADAWRIFNASKWLLDETSPTTVPRSAAVSTPIPQSRPDYLDQLASATSNNRVALNDDGRFSGITSSEHVQAQFRQRIARHGFSHSPQFTGASNYWAVRDLDDAAAALINGPQFGFGVPSYVYGVGLHGGDFDTVGNTLLGLPALLFAHNNEIAWGSTAGMSDQTDEFMLTLNPDQPEQYQHQNSWKALDTWTETIAVKDSAAVTAIARRSVHGMVQAYQLETNTAWARSRTWEGKELATLMAWIFLATDHTLDAAHQRISAMATNINMYTMDRAGNLGYVHSGRYPSRAAGHDSRLPAAGSGQWDWQGLRPYSDNPTARNPQQGYIVNWNNRPAANWISSDLWSQTWSRADRASLIFDALQRDPSAGGSKPTVDDIKGVNGQISFADVNAPYTLPALLSAWKDQAQSPQIAAALEALSAWDQQWPVDSSGQYGATPALMDAWLRTLLADVFKDDIGDEFFHLYSATNYPNSPLGPSMGTPPGIRALVRNSDRLAGANWGDSDYDFFNGQSPAKLLRASFQTAVAAISDEQGPDITKWRLAAEPMRWKPYNFRGVPQARETAAVTLPSYMNRGSENNLFVATGDGITAWDVNPPGQSGFQASDQTRGPNTNNQMQLYADFGYKSIPFEVEAIKAEATKSQTLLMKK